MQKMLIWYGPLLKATVPPLIALGLVLLYHDQQYSVFAHTSWWTIWGWFYLGIYYTHIFEYLDHRFAMHYGIPGLKWMKTSHRKHHRVFHPLNYKTRNPPDLNEISSSWYLFPVLLFIHYFLFLTLLPDKFSALAPAFFLGVMIRFLTYEITHYFSHLADNFFDRWVEKIPLVWRLRTNQDKHHFRHHVRQEINFGFVPDWVPDWLGGTLFPPFKFNRRH